MLARLSACAGTQQKDSGEEGKQDSALSQCIKEERYREFLMSSDAPGMTITQPGADPVSPNFQSPALCANILYLSKIEMQNHPTCQRPWLDMGTIM